MTHTLVHLINPDSLWGATLCGRFGEPSTRDAKRATCVWCKDSRLRGAK